MKTVKMLNRDFGITVIFITHYMDEAVQANRVVVMNEGKILLDGTPKAVFTQTKALEDAGLEVPQATQLAALLRADGYDVPKDILDMDELYDAVTALVPHA